MNARRQLLERLIRKAAVGDAKVFPSGEQFKNDDSFNFGANVPQVPAHIAAHFMPHEAATIPRSKSHQQHIAKLADETVQRQVHSTLAGRHGRHWYDENHEILHATNAHSADPMDFFTDAGVEAATSPNAGILPNHQAKEDIKRLFHMGPVVDGVRVPKKSRDPALVKKWLTAYSKGRDLHYPDDYSVPELRGQLVVKRDPSTINSEGEPAKMIHTDDGWQKIPLVYPLHVQLAHKVITQPELFTNAHTHGNLTRHPVKADSFLRNKLGNQAPVTVDRHEARGWGMSNEEIAKMGPGTYHMLAAAGRHVSSLLGTPEHNELHAHPIHGKGWTPARGQAARWMTMRGIADRIRHGESPDDAVKNLKAEDIYNLSSFVQMYKHDSLRSRLRTMIREGAVSPNIFQALEQVEAKYRPDPAELQENVGHPALLPLAQMIQLNVEQEAKAKQIATWQSMKARSTAPRAKKVKKLFSALNVPIRLALSTRPGENTPPDPELHGHAESYVRTHNIAKSLPPLDYRLVNEKTAADVAGKYDQAKHDPHDPEVKRSYAAFKKETLDQYNHLVRRGYKFGTPTAEPTEEGIGTDKANEVIGTIRGKKPLTVFQGGYMPPGHPLAAPSPAVMGGKRMNYNEVFRAVHDVFGHALYGNRFGPTGEEHAYRSHLRMYSPEAQKAMTAETKGQNSWVHYGPNKHLPSTDRPYADQKATLMKLARRLDLKILKSVAFGAASPNVDELSFDEALHRLKGEGHQAFRQAASEMAKKIGLNPEIHDALGDWQDGAENSLAHIFRGPVDDAKLTYLLAWMGKLGRQKSVLKFLPHQAGPHQLHEADVPDTDLGNVRRKLDAHRVPFRTLIPHAAGTKVLVADLEGGAMSQPFANFAGEYRAAVHTTQGTGEFVGADSREDAGPKFDSIIHAYESAGKSEQPKPQGPGDGPPASGSGPRHSPGGGLVQRGQFKQGGQFIPNPS